MFIRQFEEKFHRNPSIFYRNGIFNVLSDWRTVAYKLGLAPLCFSPKHKMSWSAEYKFFNAYKNQFGYEDAQFVSCRPFKKVAKNWFYWALYDYIQFHIKNKTHDKCMFPIDPFNKTIQMTFVDFGILMSSMSVPIDELYGGYGCSDDLSLTINNQEFVKPTKLYKKYPKALIAPFFDLTRSLNLAATMKIDHKDFLYNAYTTLFRDTGLKEKSNDNPDSGVADTYGCLLPDVRHSLFNVDKDDRKTPVMKNQQDIFDFLNKDHVDTTQKQVDFVRYLENKRANINVKEITLSEIDKVANKIYKEALKILATNKGTVPSGLTPAVTRFSKKKCADYVIYWGLVSCTQYYHGRPLEINAKKERDHFGPNYNYLRKAMISLGLLECKDSSYVPGFKCKTYYTSLFKDKADTISKNWDITKENHWVGGKNEIKLVCNQMDSGTFEENAFKIAKSRKLHKKYKVDKPIDILFLNEQMDVKYAKRNEIGYKKGKNKNIKHSEQEEGIRYCVSKAIAIAKEFNHKRISDLHTSNIKSYNFLKFKQKYDKRGDWSRPHHFARLKEIQNSIAANYMFLRRKIDYLKEHETKYNYYYK